jgi:hypothetical protein
MILAGVSGSRRSGFEMVGFDGTFYQLRSDGPLVPLTFNNF